MKNIISIESGLDSNTNGERSEKKNSTKDQKTLGHVAGDMGLLYFLRFVAINYKLKTTLLLSIFNSLQFVCSHGDLFIGFLLSLEFDLHCGATLTH